jgi:hypothetical protein
MCACETSGARSRQRAHRSISRGTAKERIARDPIGRPQHFGNAVGESKDGGAKLVSAGFVREKREKAVE